MSTLCHFGDDSTVVVPSLLAIAGMDVDIMLYYTITSIIKKYIMIVLSWKRRVLCNTISY